MTLKFKNTQSSKTEELEKAIKVGSDEKPMNFHWKNDDAKEFIDYVIDESNGLLNKIRIIQMNGPTKEIAKIFDDGKLLRPAGEYKRANGQGKVDGYEFGNDRIELNSKKIEGKVTFTDDELEDNIEGESFEQHAKKILAKKIANEIVEAIIYSRKVENPSGENGILNMFNGVKVLVEEKGNVVDAESKEITRKTIVNAKKLLKTKYRNNVHVFMDSDIKTDFDELYNDPNGRRGDGETIKHSVSGMPIEEVPLMISELPIPTDTKTTIAGIFSAGDKTITVADGSGFKIGDNVAVNYGKNDEIVYAINAISGNSITLDRGLVYGIKNDDTFTKVELKGSDVFLSNPKNFIFGIQRDIRIETARLAPDGYDVWYTMRGDIQVENPEATVLVKNLVSPN